MLFTEDFWDSINFDDVSPQESSECTVKNSDTNKRKRKRNDIPNMFGKDDEIWTINKLFARAKLIEMEPKVEKKEKKKEFKLNSKHFWILKHDIRKQYAAMIANILNSSDYYLIKKFLETYAVPNIELQFQHDPFGSYDPLYTLNESFKTAFVGPSDVAFVMAGFPDSAPDYAYEVMNAQIKTRSDEEGSIIVTSYTARASYLYKFNFEQYLHTALSQDLLGSSTSSHTPILLPSYEDFLLSQRVSSTPSMRQNPFLFTVHGTCTLLMNEQKRILSILFTRYSCTVTRLVGACNGMSLEDRAAAFAGCTQRL